MTRFELGSSGIVSDRTINCATALGGNMFEWKCPKTFEEGERKSLKRDILSRAVQSHIRENIA